MVLPAVEPEQGKYPAFAYEKECLGDSKDNSASCGRDEARQVRKQAVRVRLMEKYTPTCCVEERGRG